ncbi:unnamed protein product, partial [marine sediment metagenome]
YNIKPGEKKQIYIGFKNNENTPKKFIIKGIKASSMPEDIDCGLYEEDDVMLEYKHKATTVESGATIVLPMNIKVDSGTNTGTCFYEILIDEEDDSLAAYWNFNKEDDATDISGNGNDGTIYDASWTDGKVSKALEFDGDGDYVNCGNDSSLDISQVVVLRYDDGEMDAYRSGDGGDDGANKWIDVSLADTTGNYDLWIYGYAVSCNSTADDDFRLRVNNDPAQTITFNWCDLFGLDTGSSLQDSGWDWKKFEIPRSWLVEGENKFNFWDISGACAWHCHNWG